MDPWYHYGRGDPLDAAFILVHYAHMNGRGDVEPIWDMLTAANASVFGVDDYGLSVGADGSLVVYDARTRSMRFERERLERWYSKRGAKSPERNPRARTSSATRGSIGRLPAITASRFHFVFSIVLASFRSFFSVIRRTDGRLAIRLKKRPKNEPLRPDYLNATTRETLDSPPRKRHGKVLI